MFAAWTVGINLFTRSNFGMVAGNIARQAGVANVEVTALSRRMNSLHGSGNIATNAMMGFGVAAGAAFAIGVKGASDLQQKINQLSISLGQSPQMVADKYIPRALNYTRRYGSSLAESMDEIRALSTIFKTDKQLNAVMPTAMMFANVMHRGPDQMDRVHAIKSFGKVSHMMGAYDVDSSIRIADSLAKKGYASAGKMDAMINQLGYFSEMWSRAGVKPEKILQAAIFGDLTLPGKYGAAYDQLYKNLIAPTKPMLAAQKTMGIRDRKGNLRDGIFDSQGHFDPMAFFTSAEKHTRGMSPEHGNALFYHAFNVRAVRSAIQGANPKALAYNKALGTAIGREPSLKEMNARLMHDLFIQTDRLSKNFGALATFLARPWMQNFINAVSNAADALGGFAAHMHAHPVQAKVIGGAMMGFGALAIGLALKAGFGVAAHLGHAMGLPKGAGFSIFRHIGGHGGAKVAAEVGEVASHTPGVGRLVGAAARLVGNMLALPYTRDALAKAGSALFKFRGFPGGGVPTAGLRADMMQGLRGAGEPFAYGARAMGSKFLGQMPGFAEAGRLGGGVLSKFGELFARMGSSVGSFLTKFGGLRGILTLIGEKVAGFGLKAIPVVGEVLMLIDVLRFFLEHTKDIGKVLGSVAGWIMYKGGPMLGNALISAIKFAFMSIIPALGAYVRDSFIGIFTGKKIGLVGQLEAGRDSFIEAKNHQDAAYMAANQARYNASRHAAKISHQQKSHAKQVSFVQNFHYQAAPGNDAQSKRNALDHARQVANETARVISATMRTSMRSAGSTIATLGMSPLELNPSV